MAKSRIAVALERIAKGRAKPNTVNPTITKSRRYDKGGKLKSTKK